MTLREAFQQLYDRDGGLTAEQVVEEARSGKDAVAERLRQSLPWDKEDALYQYQLAIAHKLIRKVRIVYRPTPRSSTRETRAFVSVPAPQGRAYHPTAVVAEDPLMARLLLQEAERAWRDLKSRYGSLAEFIAYVRRDLEDEAA